MIVSKFSMEDIIGPRSRVVSTEDSKICFHFLVYPFNLSIRLVVVCGEEGEVVL